ncbi:MAG TPA: hypothetical protein VIP98_18775 [Microlunatus sp.]
MTNNVTPVSELRGDTAPISASSDGDGRMLDPVTGEPIDEKEPAEHLLAQAKAQGVSLVGPGGRGAWHRSR